MEELCAPQPFAEQVLCEGGEQKWELVPQGLPVGSQSRQGGENAGGAAQVATQRPRLCPQEHGEARWNTQRPVCRRLTFILAWFSCEMD